MNEYKRCLCYQDRCQLQILLSKVPILSIKKVKYPISSLKNWDNRILLGANEKKNQTQTNSKREINHFYYQDKIKVVNCPNFKILSAIKKKNDR